MSSAKNLGEPVVLSVQSIEDMDVNELALWLLEEQKEKTGVRYAYCACGTAVSVETARRASKQNRIPRCRHCANLEMAARRASKDATVYLCCVCRQPIVGGAAISKARTMAKNGRQNSCGSDYCKKELTAIRMYNMRAAIDPEVQKQASSNMMRNRTAEQKSNAGRAAAIARWKGSK